MWPDVLTAAGGIVRGTVISKEHYVCELSVTDGDGLWDDKRWPVGTVKLAIQVEFVRQVLTQDKSVNLTCSHPLAVLMIFSYCFSILINNTITRLKPILKSNKNLLYNVCTKMYPLF